MEKEKLAVEGMETVNFKITGICSCEGKIVEKKMKKLEGVETFTLNPVTNQLKVTYNKTLLSIEVIQKEVSKAGAKATLMKSNQLL